MSDDLDFAIDADDAYRAKVKQIAIAVGDTLAKFREDVPIDAAISALIWVLASLVIQKPEIPDRELAEGVAEFLRSEIAEHRAADKPVLH